MLSTSRIRNPLLSSRSVSVSRSSRFCVKAVVVAFIALISLDAHAQDGNAGVISRTRTTPIQTVDMLHTAFGKHGGREVV